MADIKISELTQVSALNNGDLVEVSQVNALAPSGYTSLKASMTDLGKKVNSDIEYTTDLADFTDKTTLGAIKETAKGKNIADEYDDTQTYNKGDVVICKNTLYICTDDNITGTFDPSKWSATTIDNIIGSLSTLTTTDKSSLVGAVNEVDGKVTPQTITITPNTTVATGFDYSVVKVGKLVSYYISCQLTASITATGTVIASGLPKAVRDTQIPVTALSGANVGQTNQMAIMTDGKLQTRYTSTAIFPNGAYMLASGCYITSE